MRTEEQWGKTKVHFLKKIPPRISEDLQRIPTPKKLPDLSKSIFIHGETNTGKTILAYQMMMEFRRRCWLNSSAGELMAFNMTEMITNIQNSWSDPHNDIFRELENCNLLLIDDFGIGKPSDWLLHTLYQLINHRYDYKLPTILTSNKSLPEISEIFGDDRITSRIERSYLIIEKQPYTK